MKVAWKREGEGSPSLFDPDVEWVADLAPGPAPQKGDMVWAVPSSTMGAFHDASLIQRLVSTVSAREYEEIHRALSEAGYPNDVLAVAPAPS